MSGLSAGLLFVVGQKRIAIVDAIACQTNSLSRAKASLRVLAETEEVIVVDKPAHLLVHPSKPDGTRTLWHGLRELLAYELANGGQVSIINRLDRETSGITLVAKNRDAARKYAQLMQQRRIAKEYLAIVWGWPGADRYEIDAPIIRRGEVEYSRIHLKRIIHPAGAAARTRVVVERRVEIETTAGTRFSVVRAFPETGRIHQIRLHLAHIGHPVVGDKLYGPDESHYLEFIETGWTPRLAHALLLDRQALHSAALQIEGGEKWQSPMPPDMAAFLDREMPQPAMP